MAGPEGRRGVLDRILPPGVGSNARSIAGKSYSRQNFHLRGHPLHPRSRDAMRLDVSYLLRLPNPFDKISQGFLFEWIIADAIFQEWKLIALSLTVVPTELRPFWRTERTGS